MNRWFRSRGLTRALPAHWPIVAAVRSSIIYGVLHVVHLVDRERYERVGETVVALSDTEKWVVDDVMERGQHIAVHGGDAPGGAGPPRSSLGTPRCRMGSTRPCMPARCRVRTGALPGRGRRTLARRHAAQAVRATARASVASGLGCVVKPKRPMTTRATSALVAFPLPVTVRLIVVGA